MSEPDSGATAPSKTALVLVPKASFPPPAHARDPRRDAEPCTARVYVLRSDLFDMLEQLKQLSPCHKDPHRFHERKDELVAKLFDMATTS